MTPKILSLPILALLLTVQAAPTVAQEEAAEEDQRALSNATELSLVVTAGNSETETLGFRNLLGYRWPEARYSLRLEAVRSKSAGPAFIQVDPEAPPGEQLLLVEPAKTLDAEKYLIETIYEHDISERFFWNAGLTWDRNENAGILNRYQAFAGVGHTWWEREDLHFATSYGLSYTDREEVSVDAGKEDQFAGFRLGWSYRNLWGAVTTFGNDLSSNVNLSDTSDWSGDMTTWVAVAMNSRVALKVSLQWLYNNRPALRAVDVIAVLPGSPRSTSAA